MICSVVLRRVSDGAHKLLWSCSLFLFCLPANPFAATVGLAWDPSPDPSVSGYKVYYGQASRTYTSVIDAGAQTSTFVSNLVVGTTYYFAATTMNVAGIESEYSAEAVYTVPALNHPPTLNLITDLTLNENAGSQTVNLSGISSGATNETQTLVVSAFSSNPNLIPNPVVTYTSPASTGSLGFTPAANAYGNAAITVMVDDGGTVNNTIIRSFGVTVNPVNAAPTLDPIANVTINQNAGAQTVSLTGIGSGAPNEVQPLTVTATSSNPSLIPNPVVNYTSPSNTGTLTFAPSSNALGTATITVTVDDAQPTNHSASASFTVTVNQTVIVANAITNVWIAPNSYFRFPIYPPYTNNDRLTFSLEPGAPLGATIAAARRGNPPALIWSPSAAQASTTNIITIRIDNRNNPILSTNQTLVVFVQDYLGLGAGSTSVQAGQNGVLPLYLQCSEGLTNVTFTLAWASNRFSNPSLFVAVPGVASSSVQNQTTNLLVSLQMSPGQVLQGSNLIAQLSFQSVPGQSSAFIKVPAQILSSAKPSGAPYQDYFPQTGQIAVVNNVPLLAADLASSGNRVLTVYGQVGARYQVQYNTNLTTAGGGTWRAMTTYNQTNVAQSLTPPSTLSPVVYRVQQQ